MKLAVMVCDSPWASPAARSALLFVRAALLRGCQVLRVFFYHEGVLVGQGLAQTPSNQIDIGGAWSQLAQERDLDLVLCVAAAQRRGVLDQASAAAAGVAGNVRPGFRLAGLGQWVDAALAADRVLKFGSGGV